MEAEDVWGQLSPQPTTVAPPPITTVQNHPSEQWVEGVSSIHTFMFYKCAVSVVVFNFITAESVLTLKHMGGLMKRDFLFVGPVAVLYPPTPTARAYRTETVNEGNPCTRVCLA